MLPKEILTVVPYSIRTIRKLVAKSIGSSLTFQQYRILLLAGKGKSQTEMAEVLQVSMAAVSKMADVLVNKKLAVRSHAEDRRRVDLVPTTSGKKILKSVTGKLETQFESKIKTLTKKEKVQLHEGLTVLEKLMGQFNEN